MPAVEPRGRMFPRLMPPRPIRGRNRGSGSAPQQEQQQETRVSEEAVLQAPPALGKSRLQPEANGAGALRGRGQERSTKPQHPLRRSRLAKQRQQQPACRAQLKRTEAPIFTALQELGQRTAQLVTVFALSRTSIRLAPACTRATTDTTQARNSRNWRTSWSSSTSTRTV